MTTNRQRAMSEGDAVSKVAEVTYAEMPPMDLGPMSVSDYLSGPESNEHQELRYGWLLREPTPATAHQLVMFDIHKALESYVSEHRLGCVVQHLDVILDEKLRLVVQPDLLVVLNERSSILREKVWGAPNLTVEILSPSNRAHDRVRKLAWYRKYGVQEYWIVDPVACTVEVFDLEDAPVFQPRVYGCEADLLASRVIEGFSHPVARFFEHAFDYFHETPTFWLTDRPAPSTPDANAAGEVRYDTDPA
jgi:Uma2 family endonuclease